MCLRIVAKMQDAVFPFQFTKGTTKRMRKPCVCFLLGVLICLGATAAHAQDTNKLTLFGGYSFMLNSWGNDCVAACLGGSDVGLQGYTGSVSYNLTHYFGLEANLSGHNGTTIIDSETPSATENGLSESERQDIYTYTFGPRFTVPVPMDFEFFGHALVGGLHGHEGFTDQCIQSAGGTDCYTSTSSSSRGNGFALKTGGGVDWTHGHWGIRILELDFVRLASTQTESCSTCEGTLTKILVSGNNVELSTGVIINLK